MDNRFFICYNLLIMSNIDERKIDINLLLDTLRAEFPDAKCELNYTTPFELLVAVILSAQCTDKRVNAVTPALFEFCNTAFGMSKLTETDIIPFIRSCGFFNNKAKSIIKCSKELVEKYNGEVPSNRDFLEKLSGVGRKTANVVYSEAFGGQAIAVDTHVFRVSNRIGLVNTNTPEQTEKALNEIIPKECWSETHHLLIFLGRYKCKAIKPSCSDCRLKTMCKYALSNGK